MWLKLRPLAGLGPPPAAAAKAPPSILGVVIGLCCLLPLSAAPLAVVLVPERLLVIRWRHAVCLQLSVKGCAVTGLRDSW